MYWLYWGPLLLEDWCFVRSYSYLSKWILLVWSTCFIHATFRDSTKLYVPLWLLSKSWACILRWCSINFNEWLTTYRIKAQERAIVFLMTTEYLLSGRPVIIKDIGREYSLLYFNNRRNMRRFLTSCVCHFSFVAAFCLATLSCFQEMNTVEFV
jgi:hypothetical protein